MALLNDVLNSLLVQFFFKLRENWIKCKIYLQKTSKFFDTDRHFFVCNEVGAAPTTAEN